MSSLCGMVACHDLHWNPLFSRQMICKQYIILNHVFFRYESNLETVTFNIPYYKPGGNPWAAPDGWNVQHPPLHLNLDIQTPYFLHGGAIHVATGVCYKIRVFL